MIAGFVCCTQGEVPFEVCLEQSLSHPENCQFTYPILSAMVKGLRQETTEITVTNLLNCLRKIVLQRKETIFVKPEDLYFTFRGQLFHTLIASSQIPGAIVETRFSREIGGLTISGQPDVIFPEQKRLVDYKSARRVPEQNEAYPSHALQVNIYRWLVAPVHEVENLEIVYLDMDKVKRIQVPLMNPRRITSLVSARVRILRSGIDTDKLPGRVGPDGLWQCKGYCPFTAKCWPHGVPTPQELRGKQLAKVKAIRRPHEK